MKGLSLAYKRTSAAATHELLRFRRDQENAVTARGTCIRPEVRRVTSKMSFVSSFGDFGLIAETDIRNLAVWIVSYHHNGTFARP